jgi:hypothetical protein
MKKQIQSKGKIVLYELCNDRADSRKKCLALELVLLTDNGKVEKSWAYEVRELRWALEGYKTLLDAQARGVLNQRDKWKPYQGDSVTRGTLHNGVSRLPDGARNESLAIVDR